MFKLPRTLTAASAVHPGEYPVKFLLVLVLLLPSLVSAADTGCDQALEKRIVVGQQPVAGLLYAGIRREGKGSWDKGFWKETFTYIGDAHTTSGTTYRIAFLETISGEACRATQRLFIFDGNNGYLGQYFGIETDAKDIRIDGAVLYFPFPADSGNTLDLEDGPPRKAWLDGDNTAWEPGGMSD